MKKIFSFLIIIFTSGILLAGQSQNGVGITEDQKIDNEATLGLAGTNNSLAYRVQEIEKHLHSRERWFSISGDQSGNDWNESVSDAGMPDVFTAISGNDDYGGDADDEAKIIGTADTCGIASMVKFDLHRITIIDASATTAYFLRMVYGSDTMANNIIAGQYSEFTFKRDTGVQEAHGTPIDFQMPRLTWGTDKVWLQVKTTTDNADVDFFVGLHCYIG